MSKLIKSGFFSKKQIKSSFTNVMFFSTTHLNNRGGMKGKKYNEQKFNSKIINKFADFNKNNNIFEQAKLGKELAEKQSKCFFNGLPNFEIIDDSNNNKWGFNDNSRKIIHYAGIPTIQKSMPVVIALYTMYTIMFGIDMGTFLTYASLGFLIKHPYFYPFIIPSLIVLL